MERIDDTFPHRLSDDPRNGRGIQIHLQFVLVLKVSRVGVAVGLVVDDDKAVPFFKKQVDHTLQQNSGIRRRPCQVRPVLFCRKVGGKPVFATRPRRLADARGKRALQETAYARKIHRSRLAITDDAASLHLFELLFRRGTAVIEKLHELMQRGARLLRAEPRLLRKRRAGGKIGFVVERLSVFILQPHSLEVGHGHFGGHL